MAAQSARGFIGYIVTSQPRHTLLGVVENILINPTTLHVEGYLVGTSEKKQALFIPRECFIEACGTTLTVHARTTPGKPPYAQRAIGLQAWTSRPKFFVGFVHDFTFRPETGTIETFIVHQLIRTWEVPAHAIDKTTAKAIIINNDTTIKLHLTPYPHP